ncbi:hypothetical protein BP5796_00539 [Coleophoma crateriformis]|uniref:ER transporter 6TM N-terminal domain-containing protein n=1 Tax=Coleophoma crateriformis TaxID=565419 RepID=A0A3D8T8A4_9HELO|nr:hypothetical protein BP5796_00539 [Coleophoma crateriformis]
MADQEVRDPRLQGPQQENSPWTGGDQIQDATVKHDMRPTTQSSGNASNSAPAEMEKPEEKPQPSKLKTLWGKLGLDPGTVMMMFKGSIPPTIGIAIYQAEGVANYFGTLGYLVAVISVISFSIMPRAKYFQTLILNLCGICVGAAISLLGLWSSIKAREHTTPAGSTASYNSSQSAVCAIWLFANIWFVNTLRAKLPALQFPAIMYSIFTNVSFTFGPIFTTMPIAEAFMKRLLTGFLSAFAIATAVNLFIVPVTSRTVVLKETTGYLLALRGTIKATTAYITSLESSDMFTPGVDADEERYQNGKDKKQRKSKSQAQSKEHPEAKALKGAVAGLTALHGKLHGDLPFAKREIAWGKLDADDIQQIFTLLRGILIPLMGMSTITDIFERLAARRGWVKSSHSLPFDKLESWEHCPESEKEAEKKIWNDVMKALHEPFAVASQAMDEGLTHAGLVLELLPKPKKKKGEDVEAADGSEVKPGDPGFAKYLALRMKEFYGKRGAVLKAWAVEKGLSEEIFDSAKPLADDPKDFTPDTTQHRRDQQQLYLILYMEHLLYSTGVAITALVKFADSKVEDGTMKKKRIIFLGMRRLKKWLLSVGSEEDTNADDLSPDSLEAGNNNIYMGAGYKPKKDPEHLPAVTAWQKFGNGLRTIPRFLGSVESAFGFRVACATLTIGIIGFLEQSQKFFIEQRLVWAMIIIAIGMTMTSGQSMFGFFGRIAGTAIAMVTSFVIWYIVDGHPAGVIVMLWLFIFLEMYFFLKFPRFLPIWLIAIVTQVLIIGYELQVKRIGITASTTLQPYYPVYELAPYRLACVAGGSFVAFIWTIFPYPLSDRSWLRQDLGSTLYLLANYYSVVHATIGTRLHNAEGDPDLKSSPGRRMEKVRHRIFGKLVLLLPSLRQHADWQKWELTIGGKFPRETYDAVTLSVTHIMNYLSLISYATQTWSAANEASKEDPSAAVWLHDLANLIDTIAPTSHQVTSVLSLLSASVRTGMALPPYLQHPQPYDLSLRLMKLDKGILDARHVQEPGYSAYAVMQVASSLITDDLSTLIEHVKDLVGETDFTFKVVSSESSVGSSSSDTAVSGKGKND